MLKISDIIGLPVLCTDKGKFKGEIKDAVLNLEECRLAGFIIDHGSIIHLTKVINFNSVYEINRNKVIVKYKKNILQMKSFDFNLNFMKKNEKILGYEVIGERGNLLGFVKDVIVEEKSGNILGFIITNGIIDDIFSGVEILPMDGSISFEKERFLISKNSKKNVLRNIGGLKKLFELEH